MLTRIKKLLPSKHGVNKVLSRGLLVSILFYFTFHLISGNKGLLSLLNLQTHNKTTRIEQQELHQQRLKLEKQVAGMYQESLDKDMLDEQARKLLNRAAQNDVMILPE